MHLGCTLQIWGQCATTHKCSCSDDWHGQLQPSGTDLSDPPRGEPVTRRPGPTPPSIRRTVVATVLLCVAVSACGSPDESPRASTESLIEACRAALTSHHPRLVLSGDASAHGSQGLYDVA